MRCEVTIAMENAYSRREVVKTTVGELLAHVTLVAGSLEALAGRGAHDKGQGGEGDESGLHVGEDEEEEEVVKKELLERRRRSGGGDVSAILYLADGDEW